MINLRSALTVALAFALAAPGFAKDSKKGEDTSADGSHFMKSLDDSKGLVVRMSLDEKGNPDADSAQARADTGEVSLSGESDLAAAWNKGLDVAGFADAKVTKEKKEGNKESDSSTCGWYYHHCGCYNYTYTVTYYTYTWYYTWRPAYVTYYVYYTPTYVYYYYPRWV